MINNTNEILAQNINQVEGILMEFMHKIVKQEDEKKLNIDSIELLIGNTIAEFTKTVLSIAGSTLSNVSSNKEMYCKCGNKLIRTKKNEPISFLSMFGKITVVRDKDFCRRCGSGNGQSDDILGLNRSHRQTKGITEAITYASQLVPSFERASEVINKFLHVDISATQMQIVSEEIGKAVFEKQMEIANKAYEKPEETAPQLLEKYRNEGILYIMMDGSAVNTRIQDENNSSWKEMKLGLVFSDRDLITRSNGDKIITKKEYVTYFGAVGEFKKLVFDAAARAGYGILKKVVVIGDGAAWIWNMCEELFPDAIRILDYFHLSENVHGYAKALHPEDEIGRKIWINTVLDLIKEEKVDEALKYISVRLIKNLPPGVGNVCNYIENNKDRIKYKTYKENGYYIGSGPIESGNKTVIQQRMKQSGMRWGVSGGQYIAALRAKHESNIWNNVVEIING
jgi:Uncharacterised protein family (UPF0236).